MESKQHVILTIRRESADNSEELALSAPYFRWYLLLMGAYMAEGWATYRQTDQTTQRG